jgi:hypothetical protein
MKLGFTREVLLVEVERRCEEAACGALSRLALTKSEARAFEGFECGRCGRWNQSALTEHDVPDWWAELRDESQVEAAVGNDERGRKES